MISPTFTCCSNLSKQGSTRHSLPLKTCLYLRVIIEKSFSFIAHLQICMKLNTNINTKLIFSGSLSVTPRMYEPEHSKAPLPPCF